MEDDPQKQICLPKIVDEIDPSIFEDRFGPYWFKYADDTVRKLQIILDEGILPRDHICFKIFSDVISFIYAMTKGGKG